MKVGDIVRVVKQPPDMRPHIVDEVGYVEEIDGEWARIQALRPDGSAGGCGCVPVSCLAPETSSLWTAARAKHDACVKRLHEEGTVFSERVRAKEAELAVKHGISVEAVRNIQQEIAKLYP